MLRPVVLATVSAAALAAGCRQASPAAPAATAEHGALPQPVPVTRLRTEPYPLTFSSGLRAPQRSVVRDEGAWREAWAAIWSNHSPTPPLPAVDFTREMIIVVALGERRSGGYSILIDSAAVSDGGLVIWVHTISPGPRCVTTGALTQPVDAARLPQLPGRAEFRERAEVSDCQ